MMFNMIRLRDFDFDIIIATWPQSLSPGNEQRDLWSSQAAETPGARNYVGIKHPCGRRPDERVICAKSRSEPVGAATVFERVLPATTTWYRNLPMTRCARRAGTAGRPLRSPEYGGSAFPTVWWWDAERARRNSSSSSRQGQEAKSTFSVRRV